MPQGPVRATQEFNLRRSNSLEVIPTQTPAVSKIDKKVRRHKRSSSLGTTELKEKLRRSLQKERKQHSPSQNIHGGLHNIRDALYRNSDQSYINPSIPVFGLCRTRSLDCLSELENLTINHSPLTPHEGHKAPLPRSDTPVLCSGGRSTNSQTPSSSPPSSSPYYIETRSPPTDSPDKIIGSSPRVNCSFLFARQPPPNVAQARCTKGSTGESNERSGGPDKSKIKIIFSNNSVFNRPVAPPELQTYRHSPPDCVTRHSPAEQICQ